MLFIVGTGRCGTATISHVLNQIPHVQCLHEPPPVLWEEAYRYITGAMSEKDMIDLLRRTRKAPPGILYAESNQRLSFIIPELVQAFPGSKFIWLIRNGLQVVSSTYYRRWYSASETRAQFADIAAPPWFKYRIRADLCGEMSSSEWLALTPFERNCWYWAYTNNVIKQQLKETGVDWIQLRLKDMVHDTRCLLDFLNIDGDIPVAVRRMNEAPGGHHATPKASRWTQRQCAGFERFCGDMMDAYYPGWRRELAHSAWKKIRNSAWSFLSIQSKTGMAAESLYRRLPRSIKSGLQAISTGRRN